MKTKTKNPTIEELTIKQAKWEERKRIVGLIDESKILSKMQKFMLKQTINGKQNKVRKNSRINSLRVNSINGNYIFN